VCVLKTFGPAFAVTILNLVPGMTSVAFYRYMTPSLSLAAVVLAALALDDLMRATVSRRALVVSVSSAAALLLVMWLLARDPVSDAPDASRYLTASVAWAVAALAIIGALAWWRRAGVAVAIVALVVVDVTITFAAPTLSAPRDVVVDHTTADWLDAHLGNRRFFTFGPIAANYGSYFEIGSAAATNVPIPQRWSDWLHRELGRAVDPGYFSFRTEGLDAVEANPDVLRALAVAYVVLANGTAVEEPLRSALRPVTRDQVATIYALDDPAPYFDAGAACSTVAQGRRHVRATCDRPARLVRRELAFPGWSVEVDGRPARLVSTDGLFQAVDLPRGTSDVTFSYRPPYWPWAVLLWAIGMLWVAGALVMPRLAARRRPRENERTA
jgi:hypothetical protein